MTTGKVSERRFKAAAQVAILALILVGTAALIGCLSPQASNNRDFEQARIVRVVDGDTLVINTNGVNERVRLIGIDAPESVHEDESRNTEEGVEASNFVQSIVQSGQRVYLQKDVSNRDQYDRLLRYVWLEVPNDPWNIDEVRTKMLNAILVDNGHAKPKRYKPDTAYNDIFDAIAA